ncbi:MAG: DUF1320 domain-containing protein [Pseudomonadota bacterium]
MSYTTLQALTDRFGERLLVELTDRAEIATGAVGTGVVDAAIADTAALIDGYVAARYALPMTVVPPLVASLALDIAIYKLHIYEPSEKIVADYKAAMKSLEGISSGSIRLPIAGAETPSTGGSGARSTDRDRPMTAENLKSFI